MKKLALWSLALLVSLPLFASEPGQVTVVESARSTINGDVSVVDVDGVRILIADARQSIELQSSLDLKDHHRLISPYAQIVSMITALHPAPLEAFNMGLGGGMLPHFHLAQYPKAHVDSVEIDPTIIRLAKQHFFVTSDRHAILEGDGFETLAHQPKKYDVIWMDEYTPRQGPQAMVPADHLKILGEHLKPDGFLVVHLGTAKSAATFRRTIRDYSNGFAHAIHIQGPVSSGAAGFDSLFTFRAVALALAKHPHEPAVQLPEHIVAVSNSPALSCAHFWELQQKWAKEKLTELKWPQGQSSSCEDLHP